jgi:hypothetical protein
MNKVQISPALYRLDSMCFVRSHPERKADTEESTGVKAPMTPRYISEVTRPAAALGKAVELQAARKRVLAGGQLPTVSIRFASSNEVQVYFDELQAAVRPFEESLRKAAARQKDPTARLKAIIKKASIQTSQTRFEDPQAMTSFDTRLAQVVRRGEPIVLALPEGGGKVPVPLKTGNFGRQPDFAEFLGMKMRAALVRVLREFHPGGAHLIVVPDTCLHQQDMGFSLEQTGQHVRRLWSDLPRLGIDDEVIVVDTLTYLPPEWEATIEAGRLEVLANIAQDEAVRDSAAAQAQSLQFIKDSGISQEEEAVLFYSVLAGQPEGAPTDLVAQARAFQEATAAVTPIYMAVNHHGIRGLQLLERVVQGLGFASEHYLRVSVHAKPGNPRLALSVFHAMAPVALLPMHSLGLRIIGPTPRWGLTFEVVARMRGWQAVYEEASKRFLFYEVAQEAVGMDGAWTAGR